MAKRVFLIVLDSFGIGGALWLPLFKIVGLPTTARQNRASNSL